MPSCSHLLMCMIGKMSESKCSIQKWSEMQTCQYGKETPAVHCVHHSHDQDMEADWCQLLETSPRLQSGAGDLQGNLTLLITSNQTGEIITGMYWKFTYSLTWSGHRGRLQPAAGDGPVCARAADNTAADGDAGPRLCARPRWPPQPCHSPQPGAGTLTGSLLYTIWWGLF